MRDRYVKEATAAFYANYKEKELTFSTGQDEILWQRTFDHKIARSKISPDNRVVAVVEEETFRVTFLDATRGQVLSASSIPKSYVFDLQLSANGALAAVAEFGTAHLLRVSDASEVRAFVAEKGLRQAVFAPGETLLVVRIDGMLDFWSTATGQRVRTLHETDLIHGLSLWPGGHLFQMNVGADTKIYETSTGRDIARIDPGTWGIQPTSDGKVLQVGFLEGHGMTLPELFAAGCMALRGVKALPSVTGAELDAVLQACRARKIDVDGTSVAAP